MLTIENVGKIFGNEYIFKDISFTVNKSDKIGIVGRNGVGKSTLLSIIENEENATDGRVIYGNEKIGFLNQSDNFNQENTLAQEIEIMMVDFFKMQEEMTKILNHDNFATDEELINRYGELENKFSLLGGYEYEGQIKKFLSVFGFDDSFYQKKISEFSGGQKTRLALLKLLLSKPDYLVLDEPTNHLDVNTIEWLEEYLRLKADGIIIVSHDRFFLQRVCNKIIDLEQGEIQIYNCNYANYIKEKERRYDLNLATYENQQQEIKEYEEFIAKFRGKPNKVGQVNDRKKKLENMKLVKKPIKINDSISFSIDGLRNKRSSYVDMLDCTIGYDKPLLKDINFKINSSDKVGIVGANGAGKSTLIKTMTKEIKPLAGRSLLHHKITIGYFDQEQQNIDKNKNVYDTIAELMVGESKTMIRKHLAQFLFKGDDVFKKVDILSGGELVRLIFAKFVLKKYDMIILDEPTNHLDLSAKDILEQVLKQYNGTVILISHDRYFLNEIVNKIFYIDEMGYQTFDGTYEEFLDTKLKQKEVVVKKKVRTKQKVKNKSNNLKKLERKLNEYEQSKQQLIDDSQLEENYLDFEKANAIQKKIEELDLKIEELYELLLEEE